MTKKLNISPLKLIAVSKGLTVREFADAIGMTNSGWFRAEEVGDLKLSVFFKACETLEIEDSQLIKVLNPNSDNDIEQLTKQLSMVSEDREKYESRSAFDVLKFIEENREDLTELMAQMRAKNGG